MLPNGPIALTPRERSALKARAHALAPVVIIGEAGLTPAVQKEIDQNLAAHELIKVRVAGDDRSQREALLERIAAELKAAAVQHIGKLFVLYRPKSADPATPPTRAKTAARPSADPATRASAGRAARADAPKRIVPTGQARRASKTVREGKPARPGPLAPARKARAAAKVARSAQPPRTARVRKSGQRSAKKPFQGN